jgi:hypothetical protein
VRFVEHENNKQLQKTIGMDLYLDIVKHVSGHPLFSELAQANASLLLDASDIIFALRKIAIGSLSPTASEMLTVNIYKNVARSVSHSISMKYSDQTETGITSKEDKAAMAQYVKSYGKLCAMLSPGTTEVAKTLPRFSPSGKLKTLQTIQAECKAACSPTLPKVSPPKSANVIPREEEELKEPAGGKKAAETKLIEKKVTRAGAKKTNADEDDVNPVDVKPKPTGSVRKSGLGLKGSPHKEVVEEDESPPRKKVTPEKSPNEKPINMGQLAEVETLEKLASSLSAMPKMAVDLNTVIEAIQVGASHLPPPR